jgi:hypothetical protein
MQHRLERIESIKAGNLGGIAAGSVYALTMALERSRWYHYSGSLLSVGLAIAIAIVGGFLFGVTYRYIIRTDRNAHLNSGAVLAFGLVRGLAQIDVDEFELSQVGIDALIVIKSVVMFAIARYAIDRALTASLILPFTQNNQQEVHPSDVAPTPRDLQFGATSTNNLPK